MIIIKGIYFQDILEISSMNWIKESVIWNIALKYIIMKKRVMKKKKL